MVAGHLRNRNGYWHLVLSYVDENGVKRALILYGTDEYRLYSAALAIESLLKRE